MINEEINLYNYLVPGQIIKEGDEAFTLNDLIEVPTTMWMKIEKEGFGSHLIGKRYCRDLVKIRRRRIRNNSLKR